MTGHLFLKGFWGQECDWKSEHRNLCHRGQGFFSRDQGVEIYVSKELVIRKKYA